MSDMEAAGFKRLSGDTFAKTLDTGRILIINHTTGYREVLDELPAGAGALGWDDLIAGGAILTFVGVLLFWAGSLAGVL